MTTMQRWGALGLAALLLNASVTFRNVWPTPAVRWTGDLSIELTIALFVMFAAWRWAGGLSRTALHAASAAWVLLVVGRYVDVTGPALYGRDLNLYWDLRFVPDVAAMFLRADPMLVGLLGAGVVALALLFLLVRWALARVAAAIADARERRIVMPAAAAVALLFGVQTLNADWPGPSFTQPVTISYAHQARLAVSAFTSGGGLPASPPLRSDLSRLNGADVVLTFVESYGAVTFERPEFASHLAGVRRELEAVIAERGYSVVSAFVDSPTFGGSSWFAHISLLSGIEVGDADTNARLMNESRDTLVTTFSRGGYRTVAVMPGLWQLWPEGGFYRFDDIYGGNRLAYRGPEFGWWAIPDQYTFARIGQMELDDAARRPAFVFFPTTSTHTPFTPQPPYQKDWQRILTPDPFDLADVERAFSEEADWLNLSPSYAEAMRYSYTTIAGFLGQRRDRDFVMVLIGDHQPPALVSGEAASWHVPVHVIAHGARQQSVLNRLLEHGFQRGLMPAGDALTKMHALTPVLLDAFGDAE